MSTSTITRQLLQATAIVTLAAGVLTTGSASADRSPAYATLQKQAPDVVLTTLEPRDNDLRGGFEGFVVEENSGGGFGQGLSSSFKAVEGGAAGGASDGIADDFKAGSGCSIQCITSGVAYARGPDAELVVKTDTAARIWIHVEGPDGYYRVINSGADEVMELRAFFDDLEAGRTYTAWAEAKDTQNYVSEAHGSFTTFVRNVEVTYTHANLIERAYSHPADFKAEIWLNGEFDDDYTSYNLPAEDYYLGLGINTIELRDADQYLDFAVQLYEAPDYCNNLGNIDQVYFGPGSCSFLSFAALLEGENDLDARPADATSWTDWTFERTLERPAALWPSYDDQLMFTVPVSISVSYDPWWY